jgi:hypothetical protein
MEHLTQYKQKANYLETWSSLERELFIDYMISKLVPKKRVVETGCRSGLFCYSSIIHNCKNIIGLDIDIKCIQMCYDTFGLLNIQKSKYHFDVKYAEMYDYEYCDVVLCLGLLYNITDDQKNKVLTQMHKVPLSLVEFWCIEDENPEPHTTNYNDIQFMPNKIQAELFLTSNGYTFEEITPSNFQEGRHNNRYYLCRPYKVL